MTDTNANRLSVTLAKILSEPIPADLWQFQADLLAVGGEPARQARDVAGVFYSCLRNLESKTASRSASRWGAALATAAVSSISLQEMIAEQEDPLRHLFASGVTTMLEVGAAVKSAQAWEVEAALMYYDLAWYLYGELWAVSLSTRPELSAEERQSFLNRLLEPVLDPAVPDATKSAVLVRLFQVALTTRVWPLLTDSA